jgi:hypothetical protein
MFRGRSCLVTKSSKNPTAWTKPELADLAVGELGMKKSAADKLTKAQLCEALNAGAAPPKPAKTAKAKTAKAKTAKAAPKEKKAKTAPKAKPKSVPKENHPQDPMSYIKECEQLPTSTIKSKFVEIFGMKELNHYDKLNITENQLRAALCLRMAYATTYSPKAKTAKAAPKEKKAKTAKAKPKAAPKEKKAKAKRPLDEYKAYIKECEQFPTSTIKSRFVGMFGMSTLNAFESIFPIEKEFREAACSRMAHSTVYPQPKAKQTKLPSPKKKISPPTSPFVEGGPTVAEKNMLKEIKKLVATKISKHVTGSTLYDCHDLTRHFEKLWSQMTGKSEQIKTKKDISKFKKYTMLSFHPDRNPVGKQKWASEMASNINLYITDCEKYMA